MGSVTLRKPGLVKDFEDPSHKIQVDSFLDLLRCHTDNRSKNSTHKNLIPPHSRALRLLSSEFFNKRDFDFVVNMRVTLGNMNFRTKGLF